MGIYHHIVIGTDFSSLSASALATGARLAATQDAAVAAVHVLPQLPEDLDPLGGIDLEALDAEAFEEARDSLEGFLDEHGLAVPGLDRAVVRGEAAEGLIGEARRRHAELIVVGATGHKTLLGALVGSTTHRLACASPVPVWVARLRPARLTGIVVGVDGSLESQDALKAAIILAVDQRATLHITCAYPDPSQGGRALSSAQGRDVLREASLAEARRVMARIEEELRLDRVPGLTWKSHLVPGRAGYGLVELAGLTGAELLVVGSHGHSALYRLTVGSNTDIVLRHAPCDVLMVPGRHRRGLGAEPQ